jgi:hypothetical protein
MTQKPGGIRTEIGKASGVVVSILAVAPLALRLSYTCEMQMQLPRRK